MRRNEPPFNEKEEIKTFSYVTLFVKIMCLRMV